MLRFVRNAKLLQMFNNLAIQEVNEKLATVWQQNMRSCAGLHRALLHQKPNQSCLCRFSVVSRAAEAVVFAVFQQAIGKPSPPRLVYKQA